MEKNHPSSKPIVPKKEKNKCNIVSDEQLPARLKKIMKEIHIIAEHLSEHSWKTLVKEISEEEKKIGGFSGDDYLTMFTTFTIHFSCLIIANLDCILRADCDSGRTIDEIAENFIEGCRVALIPIRNK